MRVRILLGDPDSQVVTDRGDDEGVGDAMAAEIRSALALYRPLRQAAGVEFRLASLYIDSFERVWDTATALDGA